MYYLFQQQEFLYFPHIMYIWPTTAAARFKSWTVFARPHAGIVGSNPTQGMDVCIVCVCSVLCVGRGTATGSSPVQGVLPTMYRIKKLKKRPRPNKGLYIHNNNVYTYFLWPLQKVYLTKQYKSAFVLEMQIVLWNLGTEFFNII
jgi:hypothetical protein